MQGNALGPALWIIFMDSLLATLDIMASALVDDLKFIARLKKYKVDSIQLTLIESTGPSAWVYLCLYISFLSRIIEAITHVMSITMVLQSLKFLRIFLTLVCYARQIDSSMIISPAQQKKENPLVI